MYVGEDYVHMCVDSHVCVDLLCVHVCGAQVSCSLLPYELSHGLLMNPRAQEPS